MKGNLAGQQFAEKITKLIGFNAGNPQDHWDKQVSHNVLESLLLTLMGN
jgi:hypothetical protein